MMLRLTVGRAGAGLRFQSGLAFRFHSTTQAKGPVGIFWDIENCSPYSNTSPAKLMRSLRTVFQRYGPIASVRSYQDVSKYTLNEIDRAGYSASGLQMVDTPHLGRKNVADWHMMTDIVCFAFNNPMPSTIVVITTDRDYCSLLNMLSNRMYNIVLVTNVEYVIEELASSSSAMYHWKEFIDYASDGKKLNLSIEPSIKPYYTGLDPHWPSTVAHVPKQQKSSRLKTKESSLHESVSSETTTTSPSTTPNTPLPIITPSTANKIEPELALKPVTTPISAETSLEPFTSSPSSSVLSMEISQKWNSIAFQVPAQADAMHPLISFDIREKYDAVIRSVPRSQHTIISFEELTRQIEQLQPDIVQSIGVSSMSEVIAEAIREGVLILTNKGPKTHQLKLSRRVYHKTCLGAWLIRSGWGNKFDEIKALERARQKENTSSFVDSVKSKSANADAEKNDGGPSKDIPAVAFVETTKTMSSETPVVSDPINNCDSSSNSAVSSEQTLTSSFTNDDNHISDNRIDKPGIPLVDFQQELASEPQSWINLPSSSDKPTPASLTETTDESLFALTPAHSETSNDASPIPPSPKFESKRPSKSKSTPKPKTASVTPNILTSPISLSSNDAPRTNLGLCPSPMVGSKSVGKTSANSKTPAKKTKKKKRIKEVVQDEAIANTKGCAAANKNQTGSTNVISNWGAKDTVPNGISSVLNIVPESWEQVVDRAEERNDKDIEKAKEVGKKTKKTKKTKKAKEEKTAKKTKKVKEAEGIETSKKKTVKQMKAVGSVKRSKGQPTKGVFPTPGKGANLSVLPKIPPKSISIPKKKKEKPSLEALAIEASVPSDRPWRILSSALTNSSATGSSSVSSSPSTTFPSSSPSSPLPLTTGFASDLRFQKLTPPDPTRVKLFSSFGVDKRRPSASPSTSSFPDTRSSRLNEEQKTTLSVLDPFSI